MADERQRILTICLIAALVASGHSLSAQGPGGKTISAPETEVHEDSWNHLSRLLRGTSVRVTVVDGAEIEGELFSARDDKLVLSNYRKNPRRQAVLSRNTGQVTIERSDITSLRAPAWAQSAAHRDGERLVRCRWRWVWTNACRIENRLDQLEALVSYSVQRAGLLAGSSHHRPVSNERGGDEATWSKLPGFLSVPVGQVTSSFTAIDDRGNEYSVARHGRRIAGCSSWRPLD